MSDAFHSRKPSQTTFNFYTFLDVEKVNELIRDIKNSKEVD